jgi:hypothetical protein
MIPMYRSVLSEPAHGDREVNITVDLQTSQNADSVERLAFVCGNFKDRQNSNRKSGL